MSDIEVWTGLQAPRVRQNIKIVTRTDPASPRERMLHVSYNQKLNKCFPVIGFRQGPAEDRTVPRVCVATTLLGCIIGYGSLHHDFMEKQVDDRDDRGVKYPGGYVIYEFDYEHAIRPNQKLVQDVDASDEHWLVAYNKETLSYQPRAIGQIFVESVFLRGSVERENTRNAVITHMVKIEEELMLDATRSLTPGYYAIVTPHCSRIESYKQTSEIVITKITESAYNKRKDQATALESQGLPPYHSW